MDQRIVHNTATANHWDSIPNALAQLLQKTHADAQPFSSIVGISHNICAMPGLDRIVIVVSVVGTFNL